MSTPHTFDTPKVRIIKAITELAEEIYGEGVFVDADPSDMDGAFRCCAIYKNDSCHSPILMIEDPDAFALMFAALREKKKLKNG